MQRLRVLTEDECYTRLYGRNSDSAVSLVPAPVRPERPPTVSGELLRRLFEERLDAREEEAAA
jgi:hypothetical protein